MPAKLHCLSRFFAASILCYSNYLKKDLPPSHSFFNSLFFTSEKVPAMKTNEKIKNVWQECTDLSTYRGEFDEGEFRDISSLSASLDPQITEEPIPRRPLKNIKSNGYTYACNDFS